MAKFDKVTIIALFLNKKRSINLFNKMKYKIETRYILLFFGLLALNILSYVWNLNVYFYSDDYIFLETSIRLFQNDFDLAKAFNFIFSVWGNGFWRPFFSLSMLSQYTLFTTNPLPYHLISILIHTINGCLIYRYLNRINSSHLNFIAPVIFSIHAAHWEAITWISSMSDIIAGLLILLTLIYSHKHMQKQHLNYKAISYACMILAILTKESAVFILLVVIFQELLFRDRVRSHFNSVKEYAGILMVLIVYILFTYHNVHQTRIGLPHYSFSIGSVTQTHLRYYARLVNPLSSLSIPNGGAFYDSLYWEDTPVQESRIGAVFLIISIGLSLACKKEAKLYLLFIILSLIPVSSWAQYLAPRYMYIPCIGFSLFVCVVTKTVYDKLFKLKDFYGFLFLCFGLAFFIIYVMLSINTNENKNAGFRPSYLATTNTMKNFETQVQDAYKKTIPLYDLWWVEDEGEERNSKEILLRILAPQMNQAHCRYFTTQEFEAILLKHFKYNNVILFINGNGPSLLSNYGKNINTQNAQCNDVLYITDDKNNNTKICGMIDYDDSNNPDVVIHWNVNDSEIVEYHLYVQAGSMQWIYLSRVEKNVDSYEWSTSNKNVSAFFNKGPVFGESYRFKIIGIKQEKQNYEVESEGPVIIYPQKLYESPE